MPTYCSMFTKESRKAAALWNQRSQDQDQDQILSDNGISAIMLNIILTIAQYSLLLRLSSSSIASDMAGSCSSWVQHRTLFKPQKWSIFREGTSLNHALRRPTCSQKWSIQQRERTLLILFTHQKWATFKKGTSLTHALRRPTCIQNDRFQSKNGRSRLRKIQQKSSSLTPSVVHHHVCRLVMNFLMNEITKMNSDE